MKKNIIHFIIIIVLIIYYIIVHYTNFYIPCLFNKITGWLCPACGVSRMILSIIELDFNKAFHYNELLFISSPFFIFLYSDLLISNIRNKQALFKKIPMYVYYLYITLLLGFMIVRNII